MVTSGERRSRSYENQQCLGFVDFSKECKTIENKWILNVKCKLDGSIERHKARSVAKDFTEEITIDYEKSFSQIVKFTSIQLLLPIVAHLGIKLHQMDVKNIVSIEKQTRKSKFNNQ